MSSFIFPHSVWLEWCDKCKKSLTLLQSHLCDLPFHLSSICQSQMLMKTVSTVCVFVCHWGWVNANFRLSLYWTVTVVWNVFCFFLNIYHDTLINNHRHKIDPHDSQIRGTVGVFWELHELWFNHQRRSVQLSAAKWKYEKFLFPLA